MNVLVLCHGNINRSPLCEAVLETYSNTLTGLEVMSAGFVNPGRKASKKMREAALENGLDLSQHESKLFTQELHDWADTIVYMDNGNRKRYYGAGGSLHKAVCLAHYAKPIATRIPDPAFMRKDSQEFKDVVQQIIQASHNLAKELLK